MTAVVFYQSDNVCGFVLLVSLEIVNQAFLQPFHQRDVQSVVTSSTGSDDGRKLFDVSANYDLRHCSFNLIRFHWSNCDGTDGDEKLWL